MAQEYTEELCTEICNAVVKQIEKDNCRRRQVTSRKVGAGGAQVNALMHETGLGSSTAGGAVWDDAKPGWLDPQLVASARAEEMGYVRMRIVYR